MSWFIYALMAAVFASFREITTKAALKNEHTLEFLTVRAIFIIPLALLLLPKVNFNIDPIAYLIIFIISLIVTVASINKFKAVKHSEISTVQPLMNIIPVFVLIIGWIVLGEAATPLQIGGILFIVAGTYMLEADHHHKGLFGPLKKMFEDKYVALMAIPIVLYSIEVILDRYVLTKYTDPFTFLFLLLMAFSIMIITYHAYKYKLKNVGTLIKKDGKLIIWPAIFTVISAFLAFSAMEIAYASFVVAILRLQSLLVTIEGGFYFHEKHVKKKSLACLVMTLGAIMAVI